MQETEKTELTQELAEEKEVKAAEDATNSLMWKLTAILIKTVKRQDITSFRIHIRADSLHRSSQTDRYFRRKRSVSRCPEGNMSAMRTEYTATASIIPASLHGTRDIMIMLLLKA